MGTYTIGQVADRTGFAPSALRYYEDVGIVTPARRTDAGYRVYDDDALLRLRFIARAKHLGCSLGEITDLLAIWDRQRCAPVQQRFHELVTDKISATQHQIAELTAFAGQLQAAAAQLGEEPVGGQCDDGCACMSEQVHEHSRTTRVSLTTKPDEPGIACTLESDAMPDRLDEWHAILDHAHSRSVTRDGRIRIEFDAEVDLAALVSVLDAEQQCCSFFSFAVTLDTRGTALEVDAPDSAATLVDALFGVAP